ncbi:max isoform X2 [Labeo rohita]|uniref:Max isoform X2 n=1 Tax=Labeo rohita TaxID=84645 RepID=A0A498MAB3_LABRO|nr:max isoform X2 [Labeo rohita]
MRWSANVGTTSKTAFTAFGIPFLPCKGKRLVNVVVRALEKVKGTTQLQANYSSSDSSLYTNPKGSAVSAFDGGSDSSSESEPEEQRTRKKHRPEDS